MKSFSKHLFLAMTLASATSFAEPVDPVCVNSLKKDGVSDRLAVQACWPGLQVDQTCVRNKSLAGIDGDLAIRQCQLEKPDTTSTEQLIEMKTKPMTQNKLVPEMWGKKDTVATVVALMATQGHQACIRGDKVSVDKFAHLAGTAAVSGVVSAVTEDPEWGIVAGILVATGREMYKIKHSNEGMRCEWMSMAYDAAGIFLGTQLAVHYYIIPKAKGADLGFNKAF